MHNNNSYARWLAYQECESEILLKKESNHLLIQIKGIIPRFESYMLLHIRKIIRFDQEKKRFPYYNMVVTFRIFSHAWPFDFVMWTRIFRGYLCNFQFVTNTNIWMNLEIFRLVLYQSKTVDIEYGDALKLLLSSSSPFSS